ncbi:MAG: hypothetical protein AAB395_00770 [Patescibacteria group bacterium]
MKLSDITNTDFTEDTEPRDDHFIELLKQAYKGDILCTMAMAEMKAIQPFSDFKPTANPSYRAYFESKARDDVPPGLHVYAKDGKLIMSDDYNAYSMYNELSFHKAVCIVLGDTPDIEGVEYHGDPFVMPPPTVEELPG